MKNEQMKGLNSAQQTSQEVFKGKQETCHELEAGLSPG